MGLQLLLPIGLVALAAIPAVILFHMRHSTPQSRPVPTLRFWLAAQEEQTDRTRFRWPPLTLLLLLQLLIVAAVAFALTRPVTADAWAELGLRTEPKHIIVMLDGSTSMGATDTASGRTRFEEARDIALERVDDLREGDVATILVLGTRVTSFEASDTSQFPQLRARIAGLNPPGGRADLNTAFDLAKDLLLPRLEDQVVLLTDGALTLAPETAAALAAPVELVTVGSTGVGLASGNAAITEISARTAAGGDQQQLLVQLANFSTEPITAPLVLRIDGLETNRVDVTIPPDGGTLPYEFPAVPADALEARVELEVNDAFGGDDTAALILAQESDLGLQILLVTDTPGPLLRALEVLPGAVVTLEPSDSPAAQRVDPGYDLVVYENTAPPNDALPNAAMLFVHPAVDTQYFPTSAVMPEPTALRIQVDDPIMEDVDLAGVTFGETPAYTLGLGSWTELAGAEGGPLIARGELDGRKAVLLAFDITSSNIWRRISFPVLIDNIASELVPSPLPASVPLGDPLIYRPSVTATGVHVTAPGGESTQLSLSADGEDAAVSGLNREVTYTDTGRPGEYELVEAGADGDEIASGRFVVNAGHPTESDLRINLDLPALVAQSGGADQGSTRSSLFDLWPAVVAVAFGLLALEWIVAVFPRRANRHTFSVIPNAAGTNAPRRL
jgi:hypothetical protein